MRADPRWCVVIEALLTGLWVFALLLTIAQCCRRRPVPVVNVTVTFVLPAESAAAEPPGDDEAWLRRQLDGLGP